MAQSKGRFKGRVAKIEGSKITIDTKAETRRYTDKEGNEIIVASAWEKPDIPKLGAIVRCNFHNKDKS